MKPLEFIFSRTGNTVCIAIAFFAFLASAGAGPFPPAAGQPGSTAVHFSSPDLLFWADGHVNFLQGPEGSNFDIPAEAYGAPSGDTFDDVYDVVSLGRGGEITLTFPQCIADGDGPDIAVFENAITDTFLEVGFVEVSDDGVNFARFPNTSLTPTPVPSYGGVDPTDLDGLAGKYRVGHGTPFDLADVGLSFVTHIRIVDIVGDGSALDSPGNPVYDPYPTEGSAGFDLDAVGALNDSNTFGSWRFAHFDAAQLADPLISGPDADPERDRLCNFLEYAFELDPHRADDPSGLPAIDASLTHLVVTFDRFPLKKDLVYHVEFSSDCILWEEVARSSGGAPVIPIGVPGAGSVQESGPAHRRAVQVGDYAPIDAFPERFCRVRVSSL